MKTLEITQMNTLGIVLGVIAAIILLAVIITAAIFIKMKNAGICPLCAIKKYTIPRKITMEIPEENYDNGVALTPPMGWSSWNTFRQNIDQDIILETAAAMKESGLIEAGYQYLNLDDCWHSSLRDEKGRLQGDLTTFPDGIGKLVKTVNAMGLKLGLYTSNGTLTCEDLPASLGNEKIDALTFAAWGAEFFKYDFCHNIPIPSYAPLIEGISIARPGEKEALFRYAKDAEFSGRAKIMKDDKLKSGAYIGFLGNGSGKAKFFVDVDTEGEHVLTLLIKKSLLKDKYLQVRINGTDTHEVFIPKTKAFSPSGRHQLVVKLRAGENSIELFNPVATKADSSFIQYQRMGNALKWATSEVAKRTGREEKPIVFSICEWGRNSSWNWGAKAGNLWRTTPDIFANWLSIMYIYNKTIRIGEHCGPGGWNDPDMLEVGNGKLTKAENKAHFTLWCMMSAPLILGNDLRTFLKKDGTVNEEDGVLKIITNRDLIAIDQDTLGISAKRIKSSLKRDILAKPLSNGDIAVCFLAKSRRGCDIEFDINLLKAYECFDITPGCQYTARELWSGEEQNSSIIRAAVEGHGCKVYRITKN